MKKFIFVIIVIVAIAYYKWDDIMAKRAEMKLKSFKEAQEQFWKENKRIYSKTRIEKAFERAEKAILTDDINSVEYEDLARYLRNISKDQEISRSEVETLEKNLNRWISGNEQLIR